MEREYLGPDSARVRRMFAGIAHRYDFLNHFLSASIDRYWRRAAVQKVRELTGHSTPFCLDACSGTGDLALALNRGLGSGVIATDFCHPMLVRAAAKFAGKAFSDQRSECQPDRAQPVMNERSECQPGRAQPVIDERSECQPDRAQPVIDERSECQPDRAQPVMNERSECQPDRAQPVMNVEADTLRLPFADGSFDAVTIAFGLRNLQDPVAGLEELHRLLKAGGAVVILEFSRPVVPVLRHAFAFYFRYVLPRLGAAISGDKEAYQYLPDSVKKFPAQQELAALLGRVGFEGVGYRNLSGGIAALHWGTSRSTPTRTL